MRPSRRPIILAARRSPLAKAQAQEVGAALERLHPNVTIDYRWVATEADQAVDKPLQDIGGKGLFTRSVEQAVIDGQADLAVHSLKDMPADDRQTGMASGLTLAAVPRRADVRDCLICRHAKSLQDLPKDATLATSSPRRAAQSRRIRPDIQIHLLRGNVQTRLRKILEDHLFDATILSVAGLYRAGLADHAANVIDPDLMLPAAGQGALAIQCRADDAVSLKRCLPLNHSLTAAAVNAERQIVRALNGDCHSAIAAWVQPTQNQNETAFHLQAAAFSADGQTCAESHEMVAAASLTRATERVIHNLLRQGARELLIGPTT